MWITDFAPVKDIATEVTWHPGGSDETLKATYTIGAGSDTDAQVMVWQDLVGLTPGPKPKFVKNYLNLRQDIEKAVKDFSSDVAIGKYPDRDHSYE